MHFPKEELSCFSSESAKASTQIPEIPLEVESLIFAQFDPETEQLAFWLPLTLLLGKRLGHRFSHVSLLF